MIISDLLIEFSVLVCLQYQYQYLHMYAYLSYLRIMLKVTLSKNNVFIL